MSSTSIQAKMFKAVAADTNSIATSQTTAGAADLSLTSAAVNDGSNMASTVTIKSLTGNNSSITFTVSGTDVNGVPGVELNITGPGTGATVTSSAAFLEVTNVRAKGKIVIKQMAKGEKVDVESSGLSKREWNELMTSFGFTEKLV